jgi:hypothetical protein
MVSARVTESGFVAFSSSTMIGELRSTVRGDALLQQGSSPRL